MSQHLRQSRIAFSDEMETATMTRGDSRTLRRRRIASATPHGQWLNTTFIAGLREDGIIAPLVLDGPDR
jgi:hypothetical protein